MRSVDPARINGVASSPASVAESPLPDLNQSRMRATSSRSFCRLTARKRPWQCSRAVVASLKPIYTAPTIDAAADALDAFETDWGARYPAIVDLWRRNWERFIPFLAFDPAIRKIIYTTNAIESLNYQLRKVTKTKGAFPYRGRRAQDLLHGDLRHRQPPRRRTRHPHPRLAPSTQRVHHRLPRPHRHHHLLTQTDHRTQSS